MSNASDFIIENGVLKKYVGPGGEVVIPTDVHTIESYTFYDQATITALTIPDSVRYIESSAFMFCNNLCSVRLPRGVEKLSRGLFSQCSELQEIIIPEGVKEIGEDSFRDCEKLRCVIIPDSVKEIGKQAFEGCSQLCYLRIPKDITYEQLTVAKIDTVFAYVMGNLEASDDVLDKVRAKIKTKREKLIDKVVAADSAESFARLCDGWKKIKLEHLDEYIEMATKADATKVTAALLEYKQKHYSTKEQEAKEQDRAEKELGIKELSVADWRKIFKYTVQDGCVVLTAYKGADPVVSIPEKIGKNAVTEIGWEGFKNNKGLTEIVIPATIKTMGFSAFGSCPDLEIVRFAPGLESTGQMTFNYCKKLKDVYIPASVTRIASFFGCPNLTIHAPAGSFAETYAKEHNIPFVVE